jgi:hypothetical protein
VVHLHSTPVQRCRNLSIAAATTIFQSDLLDRRSHFHLFLDRLLFFQRSVEASAAHRHHLTHALDTQTALQGHHFPDLVVDAISPEPLPR